MVFRTTQMSLVPRKNNEEFKESDQPQCPSRVVYVPSVTIFNIASVIFENSKMASSSLQRARCVTHYIAMCFIRFLRSTCIDLPATVIRMGHFKVLRFPASLYLKVYTTMCSPISNICPDLVPSGVIVTSKSGLFSVHLNVG
jgi:hypothetical protein